MRDIKFRAWHPTSGMAYTPILQRSDYTGIVKCEGFTKGGELIFLELMQFTGLKDKNGKDIYEGDILDFDRSVWGGMCDSEVVTLDAMIGKWDLFGGLEDVDRWRAVIGNIHENPELLMSKPSPRMVAAAKLLDDEGF